jgi:hypothetical protein
MSIVSSRWIDQNEASQTRRMPAAQGLPMVTESTLMGETRNASAVLGVGHEQAAGLTL